MQNRSIQIKLKGRLDINQNIARMPNGTMNISADIVFALKNFCKPGNIHTICYVHNIA